MSATFSRSFAGVALAAILVVCQTGSAAEIPWSTDIEGSLQRATANGQPVLMEFTADWCVFCKKMEKNTFTDPDVAEQISRNFVAVKVDADKNKDLVKELGIKGLPAIIVVSPDLKVIERISGFQTPEALIPRLDALIASRPKPARSNPAVNSPPPRQVAPGRPAAKEIVSQPPMFDSPNPGVARPARQELQFEPIAPEEAPQVNRRTVQAPQNQVAFQNPNTQQQPTQAAVQRPDSESFFKTISREGGVQGNQAVSSKPAFDGICLMTALEERELVKGSASHQVNHMGKTLYFASAESKERFLAAPAAYWPMLDGSCAISMIDEDKIVEGSLEFAAVFRKQVWLFASNEAMKEFLLDPADIAEEAQELVSESAR